MGTQRSHRLLHLRPSADMPEDARSVDIEINEFLPPTDGYYPPVCGHTRYETVLSTEESVQVLQMRITPHE